MATYIPLMYFLLILAWIILVIAYNMKDFPIMVFSGIFFMVLGVWITSNGLDNVRSLLSTTVGLMHIGIGGYIMIRTAMEQIQKNV